MSFLVADSLTPTTTLSQLVGLHEEALSGLFLSQLGPYFLARYYDEIRHDPGSLLGLWMDGSQLLGLAAGGLDPGALFQRLTFRRFEFAWQLLRSLARKPLLVSQLLASLGGVQELAQDQVELTYFAVAAPSQNQGVGHRLLESYADWWASRGARRLVLSVEEENAGALRFYRRHGFEVVRELEQGAYRRFALCKTL